MVKSTKFYLIISQNFAPIWLPHWPAWTWTISLILKLVTGVISLDSDELRPEERIDADAGNSPNVPSSRLFSSDWFRWAFRLEPLWREAAPANERQMFRTGAAQRRREFIRLGRKTTKPENATSILSLVCRPYYTNQTTSWLFSDCSFII